MEINWKMILTIIISVPVIGFPLVPNVKAARPPPAACRIRDTKSTEQKMKRYVDGLRGETLLPNKTMRRPRMT